MKYCSLIFCMILYVSSTIGGSIENSRKAIVRFEFDAKFMTLENTELELTIFSHYYPPALGLYDSKEKVVINDSLIELSVDIAQDISLVKFRILEEGVPILETMLEKVYLIEPGDTLCWQVGNSIKIKGVDNNKNFIRKLVDDRNNVRQDGWFNYYIWKNRMPDYFAVLKDYFDSRRESSLMYVDKLMKTYPISEAAYDYIRDECIFESPKMMISHLVQTTKSNTIYYKEILPFALEELKKIKVSNESKIGISYMYDFYLMTLYSAEITIKQRTQEPSRINTHHLDILIEKVLNDAPKGITKERLLTYFFSKYKTNALDDRLALEIAMENIKDEKLRKQLSSIKSSRYFAAPIHPFRFEDINGKIFKPESFKGKTVILDFWFKGCHSCALLHEKLENLQREISDPNILFVTVNVDMKRNKWLEGMDSGKYTSSNGINLRVLENDRDFLEKYEFYAYPQLLVIDTQGKLISTEIPKLEDEQSKKKFMELMTN